MAPLAAIATTGKTFLLVSNTSQSVALALTGSPTTCLLSNLGTEGPIYAVLSTSAATVATPVNGVFILSGQSLALTVASNTYVSAVGGLGALDVQMGN